MEKVGGGKTLRHDIAGLHQLQGKLVSVAVQQAPPQHDAVLHERIALDQFANARFMIESGGAEIRNGFVAGELWRLAHQRLRQQIEHHHLTGKRLGRGQRPFLAALNQQRLIHRLHHG